MFVFSSRRRHTRCALVTGVQTCALPIYGHGAAERGEREAAGLVRRAVFLELLLGSADPGDFRLGVDHVGDGVVVDVAGQAGDQLGPADAFLDALVRQHRAAHAVSDRTHAVDDGVAVFVDLAHAALVELHAGAIGQQAAARGAAAARDPQLVDRGRMPAVPVGVCYDHFLLLPLAGDFGLDVPGAEADVQRSVSLSVGTEDVNT